MRQKRERSAAVLNRPAWPATPPMRLAVGSCTTPRSISSRRPAARPRERRTRLRWARSSDAATAGGRNVVSRMPSGSKMCVRANASSRSPLMRATSLPEQEEVDVAVDEPRARRGDGHFLGGEPDRRFGALELQRHVEVAAQSGNVRQQVADGDALFAVPAELRDVGRHRLRRARAAPVRAASSPTSSSPRPW